MRDFPGTMKALTKYGTRLRIHNLFPVLLVGLALPVQAETTRILALGDSLTQGYGLMDGEGFVPQLQAWLTARGYDVQIVNGGVSGDTSAGGLARVDWSLTPDIEGMIVTLGGNDLLRGLDPAVTRSNIDGILTAAEAKDVAVLLVGMTAPGNYGPDYKASFDALYPALASQHDSLFYPYFFEGILPEGAAPSAAEGLMQADGIHPNPEGVAMIVDAIGPTVEQLVERIDAKE
ncbi:arylesterase [Salipiger sp. 1_MG-2023]|uniref:arylesterase n=1 Tax=Salipiger sp. 1_MG-2023 TaxID=3062665 RepID=UPI0026E3E876|nr:arylesterase [Salipiger sp. 1_MG-2023]MDO6584247.1 arylesterase [Salipiger sp. 1_MG-2023]